MFGEIEVPDDILADGTLCCHTPQHKSGRVPFYITCLNRLACSEVREFEFRDYHTEYMKTTDSYSRRVNETHLHLRLEKLLSLGYVGHPNPAFRILSDKQNLIGEINLLMMEVDDEWFNQLKPMREEELYEKLLKDKLYAWLIDRVVDDDKGPNVLDKDGQGVIHLAAALGYDWAIKPTVSAGVSVNFRDLRGWTALHWAAFFGRERTVATLIELDAAPGALTDPTLKFPSGRTPADLASSSGHKGIAGFLSESSLTSHLLALTLKDSKHGGGDGGLGAVPGVTGIEDIPSRAGDILQSSPLTDSLSAVRNASQAAAGIHQVFRVESFQRKKLIEYSDDDDCGTLSDEWALSLASLKTAKSGRQHDFPMHAAAVRIRNKFRTDGKGERSS